MRLLVVLDDSSSPCSSLSGVIFCTTNDTPRVDREPSHSSECSRTQSPSPSGVERISFLLSLVPLVLSVARTCTSKSEAAGSMWLRNNYAWNGTEQYTQVTATYSPMWRPRVPSPPSALDHHQYHHHLLHHHHLWYCPCFSCWVWRPISSKMLTALSRGWTPMSGLCGFMIFVVQKQQVSVRV